MYKYFILILAFVLLSHCSLDNKTGFWTKSKIEEDRSQDPEEIFKSNKILNKEFNSNLKIKIDTSYNKKSFINNLTNNTGYLNFESDFKEISKFKFKKIKNFDQIYPDLLISDDNSLTFFDDKGKIIKFSKDSEIIWEKNHYAKSEVKQKPAIYFATNNKILVAADTITNLYGIDFSNGNLIWKKKNTTAFNSEIKIYDNKIFLIDYENIIRCISLQNGKEIWQFGTEKSFIKSQRKLSLIIQNGLVIFIDTLGDINALDINSGNLIWQSQTISEDIFENTFLLKNSKLVSDNETIFISNNQNKFFAIDIRNGIIKWEQTINSYTDPLIIGDLLLTISEEGYFFVLNKTNGNILRSTNILNFKKNKNIYPTGFIAAKNYIYVSLSNGRLLKASIEDGKVKKIIKINGEKISRPYVLGKQMYILKNNAIIKIE